MAAITRERVLLVLEDVKDPDLGDSIVQMGMIKDLRIEGTVLGFTCELTTPACPLKEQIEKDIRDKIRTGIPEVTELRLNITGRVRGGFAKENTDPALPLPNLKNIILIGGGKGGTGKSTCTLNLALALKRRGASVAVIDADIYNPTLHLLTGHSERPKLAGENRIKPITAFGMEMISMGFLVAPAQPMIWRGPVIGGIFMQFLHDVLWRETDYLLIDLPPASGEVPLSLSQNCSPAGVVLVSTPEALNAESLTRNKALFEQMELNVIGLIENRVGPADAGSGERIAAGLQVPFLGAVPFAAEIAQGNASGVPVVEAQPESDVARNFAAIADRLAAQVSIRNLSAPPASVPEPTAPAPKTEE